MDLVQQYISKIEHHLNALNRLEEEYKGKLKSKIYIEKLRHNKSAIEHWKKKLFNLGKESTILLVKFSAPEGIGNGVSVYKRYQTLYIGINEEMAKQLINIDNPLANDFTFKIIQPGILKEI